MKTQIDLIAGVDEAGRGPLAGPVVAAAVILPGNHPECELLNQLADSKKLSAVKREELARAIKAQAIYAIGIAEPTEIDTLNILNATMSAMRRAVQALSPSPTEILIDGNKIPDGMHVPARAIIGGDASEPAISAASILAKTFRDQLMCEAAERFVGYGFERHKGYGAAAHKHALDTLGPTPIHRLSYRPVAEAKLRKWKLKNPA